MEPIELVRILVSIPLVCYFFIGLVGGLHSLRDAYKATSRWQKQDEMNLFFFGFVFLAPFCGITLFLIWG